MRRTKEEALATRESLLNAALLVFRQKGYIATTLDDIASVAGTTRGAIHWHFGNKAELLNVLVRERYSRMIARSQQIHIQNTSPLQTLQAIMIFWLRAPEEDEDLRSVLELVSVQTALLEETKGGLQEKREGNRASVAYFAQLIQSSLLAGEINTEVDPEVAALAVVGWISGMITLWLLDPEAFSLKARSQELVRLFIQGLL